MSKAKAVRSQLDLCQRMAEETDNRGLLRSWVLARDVISGRRVKLVLTFAK